MIKLNENQKVTLTVGQLKKLIKEEFEDTGWDCDEIRDSGLLDTLNKLANVNYQLQNNNRSAANFGETLGDLKEYINELADELKSAVADFPDAD